MSRRWLLPAVLLVLLFTASLINVEPGTLGVLRGAGGGRSFVLEPGLHFRIPFLQRLMVYPVAPFKIDFPLEGTSREGSRLSLQAHFEGLIVRDTLIQFSERAGARNGPTVIRDDLESWIERWVTEHGADEVPAQPMEMGASFRDAARGSGFQIKSLTLSRASAVEGRVPGASSIPAQKSGVKIVLLGLDGADWQILDPLIESGKVPTLARLKREGAWANLRSLDPMLSPLLWTTVATGKSPEEHGVMDFLVQDPATGKPSPVTSASRKVSALWNQFSAAGLTSDVIAWWATWPAEAIRGTLVSDRVAYSLFSIDRNPPPQGAVFPAEYALRASRLGVSPQSVSAEDLAPFVQVDAASLLSLRKQAETDARVAQKNPVLHLTRILAAARTYQAIALDLLSRGQPDLFALYYQGIDEVGHRFAHYADPKMEMVSEEDHRRYRGAVEAMYRYQDRLLGEILAKADPQSLVLVLSDHGFKNGLSRPKDHPPDLEGQPARWHRPYGIFLAAGPMVAGGEKETMTLLDIAPTVLAAAGLPAAADMPGKIRADLFTVVFAATLPQQRIATYEGRAGAARPASVSGEGASDKTAQAMEENLRSLGYIGGGPPSPAPGTSFSHAALAGILLQKGNLDGAEREAKEALRIEPGYLPALVYLAQVYEKQKRYDEALPLARRAAVSPSPDRQSGLFLLIANLYVESGKPAEGLADLSSLVERYGSESDLRSALGILMEASGKSAQAETEYRKALDRDPMSQEPIKRLFDLYRKEGRTGEILPPLRLAVEKNPDSAFHANYLALALEQAGKTQEAEAFYRRALKADPEHVGALVNLASLLARQHRLEEAVPLLKRALERDPMSLEARVSLGAALSIQGKNGEAVSTLEEGEKLGLASPALYNALAMAYYQASEKAKAITSLKASLKLDPGQASARSLLAEWEKP